MTTILASYHKGVKVRHEGNKTEIENTMDLAFAALYIIEHFRQNLGDHAYQALLRAINQSHMRDLKIEEDNSNEREDHPEGRQ